MKKRPINKRILILCEDKESSLLYFKSFKNDEEYKRKLAAVNVDVYHPKNNSPTGLFKEAIEKRNGAKRERNPYNEIWIVPDKDGHPNLKQAISEAGNQKIKNALSIICFEYWVLLHFEKTSKPFSNCDELMKHLRKLYPDYCKNKSCFNDLRDKMNTAIENAEWLERRNQKEIDRGVHICDLSAYTNVHHLVKILINPNAITD